jgi:hypothetical protein
VPFLEGGVATPTAPRHGDGDGGGGIPGGLGPPPYGVGPDLPHRQLDDTWAAYWDDEAGAVYYYRGDTGEASWLPPFP